MTFDPLSLIQVTDCNCAECRIALRQQGVTDSPATRSLRLLRLCLDEHQRADFEASGKFSVRGSEGGLYEIRPTSTYNVFWVDVSGSRLASGSWMRMCAGPYTARLPLFDFMLAQKLALESDEYAVRVVANIG